MWANEPASRRAACGTASGPRLGVEQHRTLATYFVLSGAVLHTNIRSSPPDVSSLNEAEDRVILVDLSQTARAGAAQILDTVHTVTGRRGRHDAAVEAGVRPCAT